MQQVKWGLGPIIYEVSKAHRIRHIHTGYDSSALVISSSQRPLPTQRNKHKK